MRRKHLHVYMSCVREVDTYPGQALTLETLGIRSVISRNRTLMINSGGHGINAIRKCHSSSNVRGLQARRLVYSDEVGALPKGPCLWYLVADAIPFGHAMNPLDRGGYNLWRVCSLDTSNDHFKTQASA